MHERSLPYLPVPQPAFLSPAKHPESLLETDTLSLLLFFCRLARSAARAWLLDLSFLSSIVPAAE